MDSPDLIRPERLRRYTREEYDRMVELGLFDKERVELLYGMVVTVSPQGVQHAHAIQELSELLIRAVGKRAKVRVQLPLVLADDSEPEPDLSLVPPGDYRTEHPRTAWLVIEVASSSLEDDRSLKGRMYAEAEIPEHWLVDVLHSRVECYLAPKDGRYTQLTTHGPNETIHPRALADVSVPLDQILPR